MQNDKDGFSEKTENSSIEAIIDRLTATHEDERKRLLRYMGSKMDDKSRLKSFSAMIDYYYDNRFKFRPKLGKSVLLFCGLIRALKSLHYSDTRGLSRKDSERHVPVMEDLRRGRTAVDLRLHKQGKKRGRLEKLMAEIVELRSEGNSYQFIVNHLKKYHRIQVSSEYLRKVVNHV